MDTVCGLAIGRLHQAEDLAPLLVHPVVLMVFPTPYWA